LDLLPKICELGKDHPINSKQKPQKNLKNQKIKMDVTIFKVLHRLSNVPLFFFVVVVMTNKNTLLEKKFDFNSTLLDLTLKRAGDMKIAY